MDPASSQNFGEVVGLVIRYFMIAALVVAVISFFLKRYSLVRVIKNIFSWIFLLLGGMCLLVFTGNLAFGKSFFEFLAIGIVCLGVGWALRRWRFPVEGNKS